MKITVLCVGRIKESYLSDGIREYSKRIKGFSSLHIIEVADEKCPERLSPKEREKIKSMEGEKLLSKLPRDSFPVTLEIEGRPMSSKELARQMETLPHRGFGHMAFIIGGSLGLGDNVRRVSRLALSFSSMTFPHQLMRLILMEQIYRALSINRGTAYHK